MRFPVRIAVPGDRPLAAQDPRGFEVGVTGGVDVLSLSGQFMSGVCGTEARKLGRPTLAAQLGYRASRLVMVQAQVATASVVGVTSTADCVPYFGYPRPVPQGPYTVVSELPTRNSEDARSYTTVSLRLGLVPWSSRRNRLSVYGGVGARTRSHETPLLLGAGWRLLFGRVGALVEIETAYARVGVTRRVDNWDGLGNSTPVGTYLGGTETSFRRARLDGAVRLGATLTLGGQSQ